MAAFIDFMNNPIGRGLRLALGVALIYFGFAVIDGTVGSLVAALGVVPIAMAIAGRCLIEFVVPGAAGSH